MRRIAFVPACCLTFFAVSACTETLQETGSAVQGEVVLDLSAQKWTRPVVKSQQARTELDNSVSPDDFTVEIFRTDGTDGDVRIFRESYADVKGQSIGLNGGRFRLYAYYGDPDAAGFDAWYYAAEQDFSITAEQRHVSLSAVAKLSNVAVAVEFGENIAADYPDAYAEVSCGEDALLTFSQEETRVGYMPAGKLTVRVYATVDGELRYFEYRPADGDDVYEPNDFVTFRLDTAPGESSVSLSVSIDRETELIEKAVEIPASMLPQEAPVINVSGFTGGTGLEIVEASAVPEQLRADIVAGAGIAHCYLDIESGYLQKALGKPEASFRIDLASVDGADAEILKANGFRWMRSMSGQRLAYVDFTGVARILAGRVYDAGNPFSASISITVEDMLPEPQTAVSDAYSISEAAPEFSFSAVSTDAWARSIRGMEISYAKGNPDVLKLQYRPAAGGEWADAVLSSDNGSVLSFDNITGLTPSTEYELRAIYNGNEATAVTARLTTEEAAQVGNSGFEEWTKETFEYQKKVIFNVGTGKVDWWKPWSDASSAWWTVNSKVSMPSESTPAYDKFKCLPTVSYSTTNKFSGNSSAQIMTINIGSGNSLSSWGGTSGDWFVGELYIGTSDDFVSPATTGHSFGSRPDKFTFYHQYWRYADGETWEAEVSLSSSDGTVIATGSATGGAMDTWKLIEIPLVYSVFDKTASSIYIRFKSSSDGSTHSCSAGGSWHEMGGVVPEEKDENRIKASAVFRIDNLQLIYE